ncbi:MAG: type II toxin-antitoxin system prevent-host-death family antitoxin [Gemmatimonadetes bacterium]|nr:type II toxin-antitoxin system prevent-host-death family antitoxin [Gemmatimonadota bacterium]MXX37870.1 type II toxin-antitoxin system prevent-host-death family antitoxin [Gemmatimonadota bacterium]MXY82377.1 type II toxin-antitoxin system prevent-host-death family antitoxin [Gemmatimonadota bacterium]MYA22285.1 type II toxin-antitoxin system prevent-host-death family antitoxin [Gemmatimonadota bacterium]MYB69610.1 type II toxin-antitoxin system prevent-host-death family antitoxin [Gemmatim
MLKVNMHEAKSQLSRLGKLAWEGEEVVIAKAGEPYLRLEPYRDRLEERQLGGLEGKIWMSPDFDDPDEELMDLIENAKIFPDKR